MNSEWKLAPKTTALVLIDLQNAVLGYETKPYAASEVVERSRAMAEAVRAMGGLVVYVRVPLDKILSLPTDEVIDLPKDLPAMASEIADAAGMQGGDLLISKHHWGAFAQTTLESELRRRNVETVVLAGISTNMGVESTLRQGTGLGFAFVTVQDACCTFSPEMQEFAFKTIFPRLSHVRTTRQVLDALA